MKNILTVCTGNICRSPVAEAMLKAALPECNVWSAGLDAVVGHPTEATAASIAKQHGFDVSAHRAQQIAAWMCTRADLVLVMEAAQQQHLLKLYPFVRGKVRRLAEYNPDNPGDIADPYRQPFAAFEAAHAAIATGVTQWVRRINSVS